MEIYRAYIETLKGQKAITIAVAVSVGDDTFGDTFDVNLADVAGTSDDNHFVVSVATPAMQKIFKSIVAQYKDKNETKSFTSRLLGPEISKKLDELAVGVKAEIKKLWDAPVPTEADANKIKSGFISRRAATTVPKRDVK